MSRVPRLSALAAVALASLLTAPLVNWQATRAQTCNVRVVIETPDEGAAVGPQQSIVGWAVDLGATSGTGVDAVVASLDGALDSPDNRLVGVAEYGAPRPDVAETLGEQRFANAGFTLTWDTSTAPAGNRPLFLQAHSACGWHTASRMVAIGGGAPAAVVSPAAPAAPASSVVVAGGSATPPAATTSPTPTPAGAAAAAAGPAGASAASGLVVTPGALAPLPTSTALQPPSNLRLAGSTSTGVTLSWDAPPGAPPSGYVIYQSAVTAGGGNAPPSIIARVPGTATTVTLSSLHDPTRYTYFFTVATVGADGSASPYLLTTVSTTPANTRVPVPPGPAASVTAAVGTAVPGTTGTPTPTSAAVAAAGATAATTATTASAAAAESSSGFAITVAPVSSGTVSVSWPAQTGASTYTVYAASMLAASTGLRPPTADAAPLANAQPGAWVSLLDKWSGTSAGVGGFSAGGAYEILVRAVNASGQEFSQSVPQQILLSATGDATVRPVPTGAGVTAAPATGASTAAGPTTAAPGAAGGMPPAPTPVGGLPGQTAPATSPSAFTLSVTNPTGTSLALSWPPYTGASNYGVLVARPGSQPVADSSRAALTTTTTTIDSLTAGSQFTFQVVARDAAGKELARSNQAPATVGAPPAPGPLGAGPFPLAPTYVATPVGVATSSVPGTVPGAMPGVPGAGGTLQLTSNASDPGSANLQWNPVAGAASYSVWAASSGGQMQVVVPSTQNAAAYVPNLTAGQMTFQVRARDANGTEIAQSNPLSVVVPPR